MAAPQITGAIAAICTKYGNLNIDEIKQKIFNGVNKLQTLSSKVVTGGALNIQQSLGDYEYKVIPPSINLIQKPWYDRIVFKVDTLNISRIRGWVFDSMKLEDKIVVKVFINNQSIDTVNASKYRKDLYKLNDKNHGFDIILRRKYFLRGINKVDIVAQNQTTGEQKILLSRNIRRII